MSTSSVHIRLHTASPKQHTESAPELNAELVCQFLQNNPDFFITQEHLLTRLSFPQADNGTLSLVGRQSELLREKQNTLEHALHTLHGEAQANEYRSLHLHRLAVHLVSAHNPCLMLQTLREHLCLNFDLAAALLHLDRSSGTAQALYAQCADLDFESNIGSALTTAWESLYHLNTPQIPRNNNDLRQILRRHGLPETGSTAVIPIEAMRINDPASAPAERLGILLLIKRNPQGFSPDMGKLFLEQIGDLVSASLARLSVPNL